MTYKYISKNVNMVKNLGELHKKWTEAGVSALRVTTLRHLQEKGYQATSETETLSEASMLLEVQCEVSIVGDDLGCHVICWCWFTVFSEVHSQCSHLPGNFRALHVSFCWQALWRSWFHFPAGLGTCSHCQRYQKLVTMVLLCLIGQHIRLTWTPLRIYRVLSRRRWETPDPTMQMTWRPLSKQPGFPYHLSSATGWLPPCHAALMQ